MVERLHFHFSLSCTGEANGNPLQCSCLENLRDGGAWGASRAAVCGVAQSQTRLKQLSSSTHKRKEVSASPSAVGLLKVSSTGLSLTLVLMAPIQNNKYEVW